MKKQQAKKVWRIFRFEQRFELPDDVRFDKVRPLQYIRDYVGSGQKDESIKYKQQIMTCKASPNRYKLLWVFYELREIAANQTRAYRGYLLNENFEPANIDKITTWVGLSKKETETLLAELEHIGLIEFISLSKFDLSLNEQPKKYGRRKRQSRGGSGSHVKSRTNSSAHGTTRNALKYKVQSGSGNSNREKEERNKSGKPEPDKDKSKTITAKPNPINPKESDDGMGSQQQRIRTDPSRQSIKNQYRQPEQLGTVLHKLYNPQAEQFANEVYDAIGTFYVKTSKEGRSELACWKSAWAKAQMAGIGPAYLAELWDKVMKEAEKLRLKRRRMKFQRSPEAVLRTLFDRMLSSIKRRADEAGRQVIKVTKAECAMSG